MTQSVKRFAELKEIEARYQAIIQSAVDAIITINIEGIVESFNASAEEMFGYSADEVIGNNIKMLMPDSIANKHDFYINRYVGSETP
ncbi:MAG: PAS domain S-box protein, partial [Gammaproteobacteria bacterium]|nr:PAS domain S-box protein [Gammaproteobacteria bacterium]